MKAPTRLSTLRLFAAGLLAASLTLPGAAFANHSVLIEGEESFDDDGLIGMAEDADGDRVFGTIAGALANLAQNGTAVFVTSGRFLEAVSITGQVTLAAAPGVEAVIEAFLQPGDPRINDFPMMMGLLGQPGIVVNAPARDFVTIRNITTENWTDGVVIMGNSRVLLDDVRTDRNTNHGINVMDNAFVSIYRSSVHSTGFRRGAGGVFPSDMNMPMPGTGIRFQGMSRGSIVDSSSVGNFFLQISNEAQSLRSVRISRTQTAGFSDDFLRRACQANAGFNDDQTENCLQVLIRLGLGVMEQPISIPPDPFGLMMMN